MSFYISLASCVRVCGSRLGSLKVCKTFISGVISLLLIASSQISLLVFSDFTTVRYIQSKSGMSVSLLILDNIFGFRSLMIQK